MKEINITELKKLDPDKRIKELKRLLTLSYKEEETDEERIKFLKELVSEAEEELFELEKLVIGETKKIVKEEKKEAGKETEKENAPLEERARLERDEKEQLRIALTKQEKDAAYSLSQKPAADLYNKLSSIYQSAKIGEVSDEQRDYAQILRVAIYKKENDIEEGRYTPDPDSALKLTQAEKIVKYMRGELEQEKNYRG